MARTKLVVDKAKFERFVRDYAKRHKKSFVKLMEFAMGSYANMLMKTFPPSKKLSKGSTSGSEREMGTEAIARDVRSAVVPLSPEVMSGIAPMAGEGWGGWNIITHESGAQSIVKEQNLRRQATAGSLSERVKRGDRKRAQSLKTVRRHRGWDAISAVHVPARAAKKLVRDRGKRVGRVKSGWAPGVRAFQKRSIPKWLSHLGTGSMTSNGRGRIRLTNRVAPSRFGSLIPPIELNQRKALIKKMRAEQKKIAQQATARQGVV